MHLPESLRQHLKKPLGLLVKDCDITKETILQKISGNAFLITVGDATTERMINFGIMPDLQIVDSLEKRHQRDIPKCDVGVNFECLNPPAEITSASIDIVKKAFEAEPPVRILVKGEEDLLVLPSALYAPENSVILYGQPDEGLVIVRVNEEIRNNAKKIMNSMS